MANWFRVLDNVAGGAVEGYRKQAQENRAQDEFNYQQAQRQGFEAFQQQLANAQAQTKGPAAGYAPLHVQSDLKAQGYTDDQIATALKTGQDGIQALYRTAPGGTPSVQNSDGSTPLGSSSPALQAQAPSPPPATAQPVSYALGATTPPPAQSQPAPQTQPGLASPGDPGYYQADGSPPSASTITAPPPPHVTGTVDPNAQFDTANYYVRQGWTPVQAAALTGQGIAESNLNPTIRELGKDGKPKANGGFGAYQWDPSRTASLMAYAKSNNLDPNSLATQREFFHQELTNGSEQAAGARLRAATTPEQAVAAVNDALRPAGWTKGGDPTKVSRYGARLGATTDTLHNAPAIAAARGDQPPALPAPGGQSGLPQPVDTVNMDLGTGVQPVNPTREQLASNVYKDPATGEWMTAAAVDRERPSEVLERMAAQAKGVINPQTGRLMATDLYSQASELRTKEAQQEQAEMQVAGEKAARAIAAAPDVPSMVRAANVQGHPLFTGQISVVHNRQGPNGEDYYSVVQHDEHGNVYRWGSGTADQIKQKLIQYAADPLGAHAAMRADQTAAADAAAKKAQAAAETTRAATDASEAPARIASYAAQARNAASEAGLRDVQTDQAKQAQAIREQMINEPDPEKRMDLAYRADVMEGKTAPVAQRNPMTGQPDLVTYPGGQITQIGPGGKFLPPNMRPQDFDAFTKSLPAGMDYRFQQTPGGRYAWMYTGTDAHGRPISSSRREDIEAQLPKPPPKQAPPPRTLAGDLRGVAKTVGGAVGGAVKSAGGYVLGDPDARSTQ